ncbi:MAG: CAP domain-containing protein [Terriglobales bacterium]
MKLTTFLQTVLIASFMVGGLFSCTSALAQPKAEAAEQQLFQAINRERAAHGLPPLKWDDALANAARQHAEVMAAQRSISHGFPGEPSLPSRATRAGARFSWLSENVAAGPDAGNISQQWLQSSNHRANLLDADMDTIGAGAAERNGVVFAVADFSKAKR